MFISQFPAISKKYFGHSLQEKEICHARKGETSFNRAVKPVAVYSVWALRDGTEITDGPAHFVETVIYFWLRFALLCLFDCPHHQDG